jgi:hypothetical protein
MKDTLPDELRLLLAIPLDDLALRELEQRDVTVLGIPIARLVAEVKDVRRMRAFEVFVRGEVHDCPRHGMATEKYPCPDECPWLAGNA